MRAGRSMRRNFAKPEIATSSPLATVSVMSSMSDVNDCVGFLAAHVVALGELVEQLASIHSVLHRRRGEVRGASLHVRGGRCGDSAGNFSGFFGRSGARSTLVGGSSEARVHRPARLALRLGPVHRDVGAAHEVAGVGAVGGGDARCRCWSRSRSCAALEARRARVSIAQIRSATSIGRCRARRAA